MPAADRGVPGSSLANGSFWANLAKSAQNDPSASKGAIRSIHRVKWYLGLVLISLASRCMPRHYTTGLVNLPYLYGTAGFSLILIDRRFA